MGETFRQRRFGVRTSFSFGAEAMSYGLGDWHRLGIETVPYEALDLSSRSELTLGNTGYAVRWAPLLLFAAYALMVLSPLGGVGAPLIFILAVPATIMGLVMAFELTAVHLTEIATFGADATGVRRFLRIIRDRQHDAILATLETAWRERLRQLYATVDLAADPNREAARLDRLRQLGVIEPAEFAQAIDRLRAAASAPSSATGAPLH